MSESNQIFEGLGIPSPHDPLAIVGPDDQMRQSALRDRIEQVAAMRSANYETFPIFAENFLITILRMVYEQDDIFPWSPDEAQSKIRLTTTLNKSVIANRDRRPVIAVGYQGAGGSNIVLRDMWGRSGADEPYAESKGIQETSSFRVAVIHDNRNVSLFLGQQARAAIAASMDLMKDLFGLLKVYPPSITGPGQVEEFTDLFGCFIDLRCEYLPRWTQWQDETLIKKIVLTTYESARQITVESIISPEGASVGQSP